MSFIARAEGLEWRYLPGGKVTHALPAEHGERHPARCGTSPIWFAADGWYGTGSQVEYETAGRLPKCRRCVRLLGQDGAS